METLVNYDFYGQYMEKIMTETIKYDFVMFEQDIKTLTDLIKNSGINFNFITGPARGAFIPGVCLSHILEIEFFPFDDSIHVCKTLSDNILIVDDIIDSGMTINGNLNSITEHITKLGRLPRIVPPNNIKIAALYYNPAQDLVKPDFWARVINRNVDQRWVDFWWEKM